MRKRTAAPSSQSLVNGVRGHLRTNVVAYLALFVALGGTSAWAADKITSKDIAKNAVRAKHIKKNAVKSVKIANRAVSAPKLADGSVGTPKLGDGSITAQKLGGGSVSAAKIADGAVTESKLAGALRGQVRAGRGDGTAVPADVILDYPNLGIRLETDGDADDDNTLFLRNTNTCPNCSVNYVTSDATGSDTVSPGTAALFNPTNRVVDIVAARYTESLPMRAVHITCGFPVGPPTFCVGFDIEPGP